MTIHVRDAFALVKGECACYLDNKKVEHISEVLNGSYKVVGISVMQNIVRLDIAKMQFTKADSNLEFAKE